MLDKRIVGLINSQINKEFYSSYLYLDMSNFFYDKNLSGFGNWFGIQVQEEYAHAMLFLKYLLNNGEKVVLDSIAKPAIELSSIAQVLEETYQHELLISKWINDICVVAYELKDFKTKQFLDWFVKEQGEEEQKTNDLCKRYELFGTDPRGLYMLDAELSTRVFVTPTLVV